MKTGSAWLIAGVWGISMTLEAGPARLWTNPGWSEFAETPGTRPGEVVLTSPVWDAGQAWNKVVASWNAAPSVALQVEVRPVPPEDSRFYSFGTWTARPDSDSPRTSLNNQKDAVASMHTDTLVLKEPATRFQVRVTVKGARRDVKAVYLAFTDTTVPAETSEVRSAWAWDLGVPIRSQAEFPEGVDKWCSPTSTSMLLAYWAEQRKRPDWDQPVQDTAAGVFDPGWGGTGNWPFNMAFAGSHDGLRACVSRLGGMADLERWILSGAPAAVSVSYALLKGKPAAESGDGHLVVVRGFTPEGDVIVNDPGVRRERVRRVFPRADFIRAWNYSDRTAYLVWPEDHLVPVGSVFPPRFGP
ncbi:MAG: C39 family peptidase [Verrucomicrobia bacterium]|nr:C39 family peptidase [Verrucomicrobiota bacterium]